MATIVYNVSRLFFGIIVNVYSMTTLFPLYILYYQTGMGVQLELWAWVFIAVRITYKVQHSVTEWYKSNKITQSKLVTFVTMC